MWHGPDRDDNGVPDWQEDENYRDEAPRGAPVGGAGCLLLLALLALAVLARAGHARRGTRPGGESGAETLAGAPQRLRGAGQTR